MRVSTFNKQDLFVNSLSLLTSLVFAAAAPRGLFPRRPQQIDKQLESGEYFLNEAQRKAKKKEEKQQLAKERALEKQKERRKEFEAPAVSCKSNMVSLLLLQSRSEEHQ